MAKLDLQKLGSFPIFLLVETAEIELQIPALQKPTLEQIIEICPPSKQDLLYGATIKAIVRDTSPTEAVTLKFATVLTLKTDATSLINLANPDKYNHIFAQDMIASKIFSDQYEQFIAPKLSANSILGLQHAIWCVQHRDKPEFKNIIEGVPAGHLCSIEFFGLEIMNGCGVTTSPGILIDGTKKRMFLSWGYPSGRGIYPYGYIAISAKHAHNAGSIKLYI